MKVFQRKKDKNDLFEILPQAISSLRKNIIETFFEETKNYKYTKERLPLRSELFTEEQLENHARSLAKKHILITEHPSEQLLRRLDENEKVLLEVHALLTNVVKQNTRIAPAGEWLLDNFYLIEEQIYTGKKHLPKGYSKGLPQLLRGESAGLPRVYDIAVEIISHSDGHVNLKTLSGFIKAYQSITFLKLGELWAIPIMLRLALIENLRRLSIQIALDMSNKSLADQWADEMVNATEKNPKNLVLIIADMARSEPPMVAAFVAELTRRLLEKGNAFSLALNWVDQRLSENGVTSIELIHQENQKQAADQVSISNSISSLRFLSNTDWREFVEATSIVEQILHTDINGIYGQMDFLTRDNYRHAIEKIAKYSHLSERDVALLVTQLAKDNSLKNSDTRLHHIGYYLIDKGITQTEKLARVKSTPLDICRKLVNKIPLLIYTGAIFLFTFLISWILMIKASYENLSEGIFITIYIAIFLSTSQLATSIINWLATILSRPCILPQMDFSEGIPDQYRTLVVIPTIINTLHGINNLVEGLEIRFLANRDKNLHFALLTDLEDAPTQVMPDDDKLLNVIKKKIIDLNKKYERSCNDIFFLFHRPRNWNKYEKVWMGYERKRGKLGDLNALILQQDKSSFSDIIGEEEIYSKIKYIITLDTDTQLPRDTAWKMVSTLAHPLNHGRYNEKKKRVTEGYTILQPRVSNSLPGSDSSVYARLHGNEPGTDPYTKATSDVYQDLFKEGSFIGKGIYDIALFEHVLKGRFPENRILSHDLLEGCYARSALITNIQLYEEYPSEYLTDMKRRHRWVRGDWQISGWILPFVRGFGKFYKNPLSGLSIWKIGDNLRRSLIPFSLLSLLISSWFFSPSPGFWTLIVIGITILPSFVNFVWDICIKSPDELFIQHFIFSARSTVNQFAQQLIYIICLPYEAFTNCHAIIITILRMGFTHKHLLQWNPYNQYSRYSQKTIAHAFKVMWPASFFALAVFIFSIKFVPLSLIFSMPFLIGWFFSPFICWWLSRPSIKKKFNFSEEQQEYLRQLARKIWNFFETFVKQEDNWLPPDNYQEHPVERIAHRTSPTNIGGSLLANLSAFDFGFITLTNLLKRSGDTLNTVMRMEKYHGHLFNWYDTITLTPLAPRYISTVDSGNLIGHLITLQQGLINLSEKKIINESHFQSLHDMIKALADTTKEPSILISFQRILQNEFSIKTTTIDETNEYLSFLELYINNIFLNPDVSFVSEQIGQKEKIIEHIKNIKGEINWLIPWSYLEEIPNRFKQRIPVFPAIPTLNQLASIEQSLLQKIISCYSQDNNHEENDWLNSFRNNITEAGRRSKEIILMISQLVAKCRELSNIEYDFLYDRSQHLLTIGYNVDEHRKDNSYYDLLASEARLTTFIAIAQGKLPQEAWFALGRQLTNHGSTPILLSWSGSMFEYLMPILIMPTYENTLLDQTNKGIVQKQIEYGKKRGVPWGISESGYNMVDANLNYQYRAFGVPGIGFKRGLGEDLVVSPYSSLMGLMVAPEEAYHNMQHLKSQGFEGKYGFYEAIDYTPQRLLRRQPFAIIKSFMAHHQGMSFLSLAYLLHDQRMQQRFTSHVQIKATLLLLQERIPRMTTFYSPSIHSSDISITNLNDTSMRVIDTPHTAIPELQLLSNGRYHVMVTNSGGGYSRWKNIAITRWREDCTCDNWGTFCYIRDIENNITWSSSYQPSLQQGEGYEAVFSQGRVEFRRRDLSLETHTEIVISPEDDIELRKVHIINRSRKKRTIEITSYTEVVLASSISDEMHPSFSNLFVQTEINTQRNAIIATRRPGATEDISPWLFHLMKVHDGNIKEISYETDRSKFIGRTNTIHNPLAMNQDKQLSGTAGSVLDPIMSIRYKIILEPHESATIDMIFGIAETKELCNSLIEKYQDRHLTNRILELAWTHSQVILRQINATESDAQLYARLAASIIFSNSSLRADTSIIVKNQRGQSGLWSHSISGDLPIVLLQIEDASNIVLVKQLVQAHAYWRLKGLMVDLMIWNEDHGGYRQVLHNEIQDLISPGMTIDSKEQPGGIFIRSADQISNEDRILFLTVAHIVIPDKLGTLEEQINRRNKFKSLIPFFTPDKFHSSTFTSVEHPPDLQFFNGLGGFSKNGKEYIIITSENQRTPAPWVNILTNPNFGSIVSESGQSYTWVENSHELRLTPWNNDPISDLKGEAFYLRDEESGKFWSLSALPCGGKSPYITRHGFGYSSFEHSEDGIYSIMTMFTDIAVPVKFIVMKVRNSSGRPRKLSATGYIEWVLGDIRSKYLMHTITEIDVRSGAILAMNAYNSDFENRIAFFDTDDSNKTFTTDRSEFIGRNGTISNPEGLGRERLSGKVGAALDACAAIQVLFEIEDEEERELIFRLGAGKDLNDTFNIIHKTEGSQAAKDALLKVNSFWEHTLSSIIIETPDSALNTLTNGWLNYQTLASRIWARSGFYQSGGAFGFRDQLQDVLSLLYSQPHVVRAQIILCASRQFKEGDVQHWWHPPHGRGVRTKCSDDYLWLPFVTCRYVKSSGDINVLDEFINFIEGRPLNAGEESYYDLPIKSEKTASLYDHCKTAIEHALFFGGNGLPLMGSGDWNDGMDKVGNHGKGESVWLAFFLYDILLRFEQLAILKNDTNFAKTCAHNASQLKVNIHNNAWDGEWYKRGYFDSGAPIGSKENPECKIDSIAQSWAVLSGGGENQRNQKAMQSADKFLVRKNDNLIQLFTPPFDKSDMNPGYIKGYVPGVRENGGQYTHAAVWLVMAFAALNNKEKTWELLKMINPINHANDENKLEKYRVEPYVIAADVYAETLHKGRGGWTWYTGSAGWMYQLIIESFIGLQKEGTTLQFNPCLPSSWPSVKITYRYIDTIYHIKLDQPYKNNKQRIMIDGVESRSGIINLENDGRIHEIQINIITNPDHFPVPALISPVS